MNLTETGQSRVNGYLFVLERSLKTFLPIEVVRDAVREIESHLRERIAASDGSPNEREALERILLELGPPLHVARAYSAERIADEAIATERVVPMLRGMAPRGDDGYRIRGRARDSDRVLVRPRFSQPCDSEAGFSEQRRCLGAHWARVTAQ